MHAYITLRDFALPNRPQVRFTRLGSVRLITKCAVMFPLASDYTHICFLVHLRLQLLLKLLLLSWSAHGHATRLIIPHPLRSARVPTIELPSRGFSCCCTCQPPQGYHPPCVQLCLHHRNVPTMAVHQPSLQHLRWVAIVPIGLPLCPALECWHLFQPAPRAQGPAPISSPMKLHQGLRFVYSRVFVSPVPPALLRGSPRTDGFRVLIIGPTE